MDPKERIVREAAAMFLDEGIKSVRMDDIAARLGVSKRTLYEMFGDKRDLLEQSVIWHFNRKRELMHERTRSAGNVFEEILTILSDTSRNERDAVLIANLKKFYPDICVGLEEEAHRYTHAKFDELLDRGIEEGLLMPDMNKELALMTLVYSMAAIFDKKHRGVPAHHVVSPTLAFEYVIVNFFRGLSTHKGIEIIDELVKNYREKNNREKNN
ncbi:MAG: TetR/AcrR family transcriptional regulator [Alistipes sp.]|jgi:AcrR family transcriptional regulator|nr:TetR/AcrR family transcriptional regulator [Alistipes sp.]